MGIFITPTHTVSGFSKRLPEVESRFDKLD